MHPGELVRPRCLAALHIVVQHEGVGFAVTRIRGANPRVAVLAGLSGDESLVLVVPGELQALSGHLVGLSLRCCWDCFADVGYVAVEELADPEQGVGLNVGSFAEFGDYSGMTNSKSPLVNSLPTLISAASSLLVSPATKCPFIDYVLHLG